jgi:soluble lytic murein transglycosylase-like protein
MGAVPVMVPLLLSGVALGMVSLSDDVARCRARAEKWMPAIMAAAAKHDVSVHVLLGLFWTESRCVPDARGSAGEVGLGQMLPIAADDIGVSFDALAGDVNLQIDASARYLALMYRRADGDKLLGLRAYNAGLSACRRDARLGMSYAGKVLSIAFVDYVYDIIF